MRNRLLLLALAVSLFACDSSNPVAPGGTSLTVVANPSLIGLNGSSTITITGFRPDGNALFPGTQIRVTTSLGVIENDLLEVDSAGRAQTQLHADGRPGMANVTAFITTSSGGGGGTDDMGGGGGTSSATVAVQIGDDDTTRPTITMTSSPSVANLNEDVDITAVVRNADGSAFTAGGTVQFQTTLGRLSATSATLSGDGRATTRLNVGDQVGTATVTAFFGSATQTVDVAVENQAPTLLVTVNPDNLRLGEVATVTILARDTNGNPIPSADIQLFASLGGFGSSASPRTSVRTDGGGIATTTYSSREQAGNATITAVLGTGTPVETPVQIRDVVASFVFTSPTSINRPVEGGAGVPVSLTATIRNAQGAPISGISISFESSVGGTFAPSNIRITGNAGTVETTLTVTEQEIPASVTEFTVTATVFAETAQGTASSITNRILVEN